MHRSVPYPSPPWRLRGQAWAAAWRLRGLDQTGLPAGWTSFRVGPWSLLGAVWAEYAAGGDLAYEELAVGQVVRRGRALAITIPWIWVDSDASRTGGRILWSLPKQRASFEAEDHERTAETPSGPASLEHRGTGLPLGRWPLAFVVAQPSPTGPVYAPCRLRADLRLARTRWRLPPPLDRLPARPWLSLHLTDAELVLGG